MSSQWHSRSNKLQLCLRTLLSSAPKNYTHRLLGRLGGYSVFHGSVGTDVDESAVACLPGRLSGNAKVELHALPSEDHALLEGSRDYAAVGDALIVALREPEPLVVPDAVRPELAPSDIALREHDGYFCLPKQFADRTPGMGLL